MKDITYLFSATSDWTQRTKQAIVVIPEERFRQISEIEARAEAIQIGIETVRLLNNPDLQGPCTCKAGRRQIDVPGYVKPNVLARHNVRGYFA
jgi:hypothetical protein